MTILSENIRLLRGKKQYSQEQLADELIITRARLSKYEEGIREPPLEILKRISHYFHISIDILISVNLSRTSLDSLMEMADNRILLPIMVDSQGKDFIEIVPHKAKAGYLNGYGDPEYIENLQQMNLPFITNGKHRAFPIEGDSMPPHKDGSFIVGRYVENIGDIKDGKSYVILSKTEGIVYKRVFRKNKKENTLVMFSDNPVYKPFELKANHILEVWEYVCSFCTKEYEPDDLNYESIRDMFRQIRMDIAELRP